LNGKLQIKGLGTALKLLFTATPLTSLRRTELIALVNLLVKLSESVHFYENFLRTEEQSLRKFYGGRWVIMAVICRFIN
jgi:Endoplasmic Reticulum Oxidoreductin 1 (ERO1)